MDKSYIESNILEYDNVKNIYGYNAVIEGENEDTYYNKEFRYSSDKILWSDYKSLTNKNLSNITVYDNKIYIQYRFTKVGDGYLSIDSISLDINYVNESADGIPACHWTTYNNANRYAPQLVFSNNSTSQNLFNPYALGNSYSLYSQLSTLVSNMFGFCVTYFKTEPNSRSRDVVLKEYSIEHVIDKQSVKILVPDNQLPTRELQFNTMMIDYPVQFEIHIVKSAFYNAFGEGSHPDPHDYIYFQTYMNKMYMVDAVSEPDDFGYNGTYWRVSLVPYQELSSVKFNDEDLMTDTESLIFSAEGKFEEEREEEIADTRKDNQLNDMGDWQEGQDGLRRYLEPNVRIKSENLYNDWTIIAQQYYDLATVDKLTKICEYRYTTGFSSNDERMITFLFKPNDISKSVSSNILISDIEKGKYGIRFKVSKWSVAFKEGNYVKVSRTNQLDGYKKIVYAARGSMYIEIEGEYNTSMKLFCSAKVVAYEANEFINIRNDESTLLDIAQLNNNFIVNANGKRNICTFDDFGGFENKWYGVVFGMYRGLSNIWVYELTGSEKTDNHHSKFKLVGKSSGDLGDYDFGKTCYYDIMACNASFTNFRLWSKLCEEDKHDLILSQYVVDDTHNTLIVDNAQSELLLNNKWS
jgi:hypothetical protein